MPNVSTPMVDYTGKLTIPWVQFMQSLSLRAGGPNNPTQNSVYLVQNGSQIGAYNASTQAFLGNLSPSEAGNVYFQNLGNGLLEVFDSSTDEPIGSIALVNSNGSGAPELPIIPGASPWVYTAIAVGTLVVTGAQVEISRDQITWVVVSVQGGAVPVLINDYIRLTWYSNASGQTTPPTVNFFPSFG